MPYERPTLQTIKDRIEADLESRLTGDAPLLMRGILRVLVRVFAGAMHILYGFLAFIADQLFVTTAEREYLTRLGTMWGVARKSAAFALGNLTFVGSNGTLVPQSTRVATEEGIEYETTADGTVAGGVAVIAATAVEAGTDGNTSAPSPSVELIEPIAGITSVSISTDFGGGEDEEADEDYRARLLLRIQNPPAGGTAADYILWAKSVSGVDNAWSYPTTPGPGQVTVIFTGSATISAVETYIETVMPVTSDLTVDNPTDKTVDFDISITPNSADLQTAITANLTQLLEEVARPGDDLLISQVRDAISSTGVTDYDITGIDVDAAPVDPDSNIVFSGFEYPILGTVTIIELV